MKLGEKTKQELLAELGKLRRRISGLRSSEAQSPHGEETLKASLALLYSLIENMDAGVLVESSERTIVVVNSAFCSIFSIPAPRDSLVGANCVKAAEQSKFLLAEPDGFVSRIEQIVSERRKVIGEEIKFADGRVFVRNYLPIVSEDVQFIGHMWEYVDVTGQQQSEEALRESELRFRGLLEQAFEAVIIADQGKVLDVNSAFVKMFGYEKPDEVVGKTAFDMTAQESHALIRDKIRSGSNKPYEITGIKKDGARFQLEVVGHDCRYQGREVRVVAMRDITERKQAEQSIVWFQAILQAFPDLYFRLDTDGVILDYNAWRASELFAPPDVFLGRRIQDILPEEPGGKFQSALDEVHKTNGLVFIEYGLKVPAGEHYYEARLLPLIERQILVVVRNVTERRRAELALYESEKKNKTLLAAIPDLIFRAKKDGTFVDFKAPSTIPMLIPPEMFSGQNIYELAQKFGTIVPEKLVSTGMNCMRQALQTGQVQMFDFSMFLEDRTYYLEVRLVPLSGEEVLGIVRDMTQVKQTEEALYESERRLRVQNQALLDLARRRAVDGTDLKTAMHEITETAARTLSVERVSVWVYSENRSKIKCLDLFELSMERHSESGDLLAKDYPLYFKALEENRVIDAHDARYDPRTSEFLETYLDPNGITSMLDAPIRREGQVLGVVCHEHVGPVRQWSVEEQNFAGSVADMVTLTLETFERRKVEEKIKASEERLRLTFESAAIGMAIVAPDGRFVTANRAWCEILGYEEKELTAINFQAVTHPEDLDQSLTVLKQFRNSEIQTAQWKKRYVHKLGHLIWAIVNVAAVRDESGGILHFISQFQDITESVRAEEEQKKKEEQYRLLFRSHPHPMWVYNLETFAILDVNDAAVVHYGYSKEEFLSMTALDMRPAEDVKVFQEKIKVVGEGIDFVSTWRHKKKDGSIIDVEITSHPLLFEGKKARVVLAHDITERKLALEAVRKSEGRYRQLVETAPDVIFTLSAEDSTITSLNPAFEKITGWPRAEWLGKTFIPMLHPDDVPPAQEMIQQALKGEFPPLVELRFTSREGDYMYGEVISTPRIESGKVVEIWGTARDITFRKKAEETIQYHAYHDGLTGLPNRTLFQDRLSVALAHARLNIEMAAVLDLDMDRFKAVNDTLGRAAGDQILKDAAKKLQECVREGDTVARMGEDEFMILLPDVGETDNAREMADTIREAFRAPWSVQGQEISVTASIGIAIYPNDGEDAETLIQNSEAAKYRAKEQGRDNYHLFTTALNVRAFERMVMENSLRRALEKQEFVLYYQPQVDLTYGRMIGMEALIRWQHPELGFIPPAQFIPLAEETGLIVPIGEWVVRTACVQNKAWQDAGFRPIHVAVNLSARQFHHQNLVEMIAKICGETGLSPEYLELEITETIAMENAAFTASVLVELKKMGITISVDDFGTGYSSLSYLKSFPLDTLKIDKSFIRDLTIDPNDAAIARAVVAMGHSLKLKVLAEGVESREQLNFLKKHECDGIQGFLFSEPIPPDKMEKLLKQDKGLWGKTSQK